MNENLILLGVYTRGVADRLISILNSHNIKVVSEPYKYTEDSDVKSEFYQLYVSQDVLAEAVYTMESSVSFFTDSGLLTTSLGYSREVLIPIDFSESSLEGCRIGFSMARRLGMKPVLLHCYNATYTSEGNWWEVADNMNFFDNEFDEIKSISDSEKITKRLMSAFLRTIRKRQQEDKIPYITFDYKLLPGLPERVILDYVHNYRPSLVIMATRRADNRHRQLIGSVTAEVLDSCRVPLITVPENSLTSSIESIKRLAFFCNIDGHDFETIANLMLMFQNPEVTIHLICADEKDQADSISRMKALWQMLVHAFPEATFCISKDSGNSNVEIKKYYDGNNIQLLIVPNKKQYALKRIFKPSIAHRLLLEHDMPLLAIPV